MPWVRIDDDFYNHPKVIKAGPLGIAMQVSALCYCNHYLTDGFVPISVIPGLLNLDGIGMRMWANETFGGGEDAAWTMVVEDLINAGLWESCEDGYRIHDYLEYQPSKAQVLADREANAKRQEAWKSRKSNAVSNTVSNTAPVPNPVPLSTIGANNAPANLETIKGNGKPKRQSAEPKEPRKRDKLFDAIVKVCCVDPATAGASVGKVRATLTATEPPYTPEEVAAFGEWWHSDDWRSKKGPPTLWKLQEQIGLVRNGNGRKPAPVEKPSKVYQ